EVVGVILIARDEAAEVLQPREQPLHTPAPRIAPQGPPVLRDVPPVGPMRRDQFDSALLAEPGVEPIAVIRHVSDELRRLLIKQARVERRFNQRHFMRRSTFDPNGERKTMAVCNCHDLGPLAALRFSDGGPPFFAPAKVPSMNASLGSSPPR